VKIVCISDTHGEHEAVTLPEGDVLVHAGDITAHGSRDDYLSFIQWFAKQPHANKLFIGGNHDTYLENNHDKVLAVAEDNKVIYLNDSGVQINNVTFWGSPITPRFHDWSFMRDADEINDHWKLIPEDIQVLITHGPVWGVLDVVRRSETLQEHTGCPSLAKRIEALRPDYHIFGHIHEGYGTYSTEHTDFLNVSTMNQQYKIQNQPVVVEINEDLAANSL